MLQFVNQRENIAVVRLLEFLSPSRPWHRSLWGIGVILAMEELFEACVAMRQGHLSDGAVRRMASSLQRRVGAHPAFTDQEKAFLREQVQQVPRAEGASHFGIRDLSRRVAADYLARWGQCVTANRFTPEHFGRSVAAHLLDAGFSGAYLHNFVKSRLKAAAPITLPQLCDELQNEVNANPRREFEVLLAFVTIPKFPNGLPQSWLQGPAITAWLKENGFDIAGVRAQAALILKVQARDVFGAAQAARSESDRYAARSLIAMAEPLNRVPWLWVKGAIAPASLKEDARGVGVKELFREDRVFSPDASHSVDAALELLAHLEGSSPPAAIAGGWGAIEGLLADPSDRASAADNLATLVTCSFPRAELTALSYKAQGAHPQVCSDIVNAETNRDRCRILAQLIIDGALPRMPSVTDEAAVDRLRKLLGNPGPELKTIRDAIGESFHRLYRQRNLILHGGRLDSVALEASLRTVAKLAGAGMDRITHGHYVQNLKPMELVAKANLGIALASRENVLDCVDLLEIN
ncbi:integrase [Duganella levis]|uniref:Integrase n=1 Tax=Duganella levis TaxID=2692169 RepID=A0ABW9VZG1_9BURK|nr:integrase [Duganella levis]MYN26953.1 integrase [Duganella levis]